MSPTSHEPTEAPPTMNIIIDNDLCQGHGMCEGEAPEVFEVADDGTLTVKLPNPPESSRAQVEAACRFCPQQAITIKEARGR